MAKFRGVIGFAGATEIRPGIWDDGITEKIYSGDLLQNTRRLSGAQANDDITISNEISIVADPYARSNFHSIRYAEFMNTKWKVTNVRVQYPRIILELGGVWNGQQAENADLS